MKYPLLYPEIAALIWAITTGMFMWRLLPNAFRIQFFQILIGSLFDLTGYIIQKQGKNNHNLVNYYILIDIFLVSSSGYILIKQKRVRVAIIMGIILCSSFWLNAFLQDNNKQFSNWVLLSDCILQSLIYLYVLVQASLQSYKFYKLPVFWMALGVIIFYSCSIPIFAFFNYLNKHYYNIASQMYNITLVLCTVQYLFIGISFFLFHFHKKRSSLHSLEL